MKTVNLQMAGAHKKANCHKEWASLVLRAMHEIWCSKSHMCKISWHLHMWRPNHCGQWHPPEVDALCSSLAIDALSFAFSFSPFKPTRHLSREVMLWRPLRRAFGRGRTPANRACWTRCLRCLSFTTFRNTFCRSYSRDSRSFGAMRPWQSFGRSALNSSCITLSLAVRRFRADSLSQMYVWLSNVLRTARALAPACLRPWAGVCKDSKVFVL